VTAVDVQQDIVPPVFERALGVTSIGALLERVASVFERVAGEWRWAHDDVCISALRWAGGIPAAMAPTEPALAYYGGAVHVAAAAGLFVCLFVFLFCCAAALEIYYSILC
jgi:hypothetical protein